MSEIAEIQNLLNKYCLALDENNAQKLASCFNENGVLEIVKLDTKLTGRAEIVEHNLPEKVHNAFGPLVQHWEGNVNVTFTDLGKHRAYNKSYWKCIKTGKIVSYGQHLDDLVYADGEWSINKRVVIHQWSES